MKVLNLGLESISFQSGSFYRELTAIIEQARKGPANKETKAEVGKQIALCTAKHTNILTTVEFVDNYDNACIFPKFFTPDNTLYTQDGKQFFKDFYAELSSVRSGQTIEGWINPTTSKVGGAFADMTHATYYDTAFIFNNKKFSAEGAAAVVLHEIGHGFTFMQFVADTAMLNVVLQQTYQQLMEATDEKDIKMVITRNRKRLKLPNASDWSEETYSKDKGTLLKVMAAEAVLERQKTDNKVYYTQNTAEELAEIFAVRHGGAKGLIEVRQYFASRTDLAGMNFGVLNSAMIAVASILAAVLAPAVAPIASTIALLCAMFGVMGSVAAAALPEFTKFSQTINKIRNQLVERIKQGNLPPTVLKDTLANIDLAVKAISETADQEVPFIVSFFDFFRKDKKNNAAWREYTDQLEYLATNDLFVRAARLTMK